MRIAKRKYPLHKWLGGIAKRKYHPDKWLAGIAKRKYHPDKWLAGIAKRKYHLDKWLAGIAKRKYHLDKWLAGIAKRHKPYSYRKAATAIWPRRAKRRLGKQPTEVQIKTRSFLFTAGMALAAAFTVSYSSGGGGGKGNDISNYKTVVIGKQTWMAENLDYDVEGSKCYNDDPANCAKYGRLYDWKTAMGFPSICDDSYCSSHIKSPHKGICPSGWHIPSDDDWDVLMNSVGGSSTAGKKLKAASGWYDCGPSGSGSSYACEDAYGFLALPGGNGHDGHWWSADEGENSSNIAYYRNMYYGNADARWSYSYKSYLRSVRCLQD